MKDNKFIAQPFVPKTETRIILERKEQMPSLVKFAGYLGISTVENCGGKPCACNNSSSSSSGSVVRSSTADIASATKSAFDRVKSQYGGSTNVSTSNGNISITYTSPKK